MSTEAHFPDSDEPERESRSHGVWEHARLRRHEKKLRKAFARKNRRLDLPKGEVKEGDFFELFVETHMGNYDKYGTIKKPKEEQAKKEEPSEEKEEEPAPDAPAAAAANSAAATAEEPTAA